MVHRAIPRQPGRYPFSSKNRLRPHRTRFSETPTIQQSLIQAHRRTPLWDRAKLKQHWTKLGGVFHGMSPREASTGAKTISSSPCAWL